MKSEKILSVGIDLGTTTSQIVLAELEVGNTASDWGVPHVEILNKKIIYRSEIIFTPLKGKDEIDVAPLVEFIEREYQRAGIDPAKIHTGAVIITGETARKENAEAVAHALSRFAGDFVVATAGPDIEGVIAAKGAGTQDESKASGARAVNLDIGGGTTNLASFYAGTLESTGCFDIGGRQIRLDPKTQVVEYIAPKVAQLITANGWNIQVGERAEISELQKVALAFAQMLENAVGIFEKDTGARHPMFDLFVTNHPLELNQEIPIVTFSGGVADCLVDELPADPLRYGDIGLLVGNAVRHSRIPADKKVAVSTETIQATVVGAGTHLTEISGSTISFSPGLLPLRNIPVILLDEVAQQIADGTLHKQIRHKLKWFSTKEAPAPVAVALAGWHSPSFDLVTGLARELARGNKLQLERAQPLIVVVAEDMAKALGHSLISILPAGAPIISIDSVRVHDGDYLDIGEPVANRSALPVVVKTLVFQ